MNSDAVRVELAGQELVIRGAATSRRRAGVLRRRAGRFARHALLPGPAEASYLTAALAGGVLTVTVPKAETSQPPAARRPGGEEAGAR